MLDKDNIFWTEIIKPKKSLFSVNLKELWAYRDLIMLFIRRDFVSQYKQTILGPIWFFLQPLFTTITFLVVFNKIAKIPTDDTNPTLFYLSGITFWTYFSDCLNKTSNTFISNTNIFGKVYFPRLVTPISLVLSNLIKLGIQLLLFTLVYFALWYNDEIIPNLNITILLLPYYIFLMAVIAFGIGIIFSSLTTKYRDLSFLLVFGIQLLMYATPVIYPYSSTSGILRRVIMFNPVTPLIENFRYAMFSHGSFLYTELLYSSFFAFAITSIGVIIFNQVERSFMDTV